MSIKVEFSNGVFKPLEKVDNLPSGGVYAALSEEELRSHRRLAMVAGVREKLRILDNPEDAIYDTLQTR
jgi:predicted DNA-binding antitoxin AbrB/MazE fold protein